MPNMKLPNSQSSKQNGKGDKARSCFTKGYRNNYDNIKWGGRKAHTIKKEK